MKNFGLDKFVFVFLIGALSVNASPVGLVPANAVWKYLADGSDPGADWRHPGFDDSSWLSGPAQLGYGEGDEATAIATPSPRPVTVYFRRTVVIPSGTDLTLRLLRDDGAVVYFNGVEVRRDNLPAGAIAPETLATVAVGGADESTFFQSTIPAAAVMPGTNVIAVEVHQNSVASSDMSFALELIENLPPPWPVVTVTTIDAEAREISPLVDAPANPAVFRISRSGSPSSSLTVGVRLSGTASNGVDYELIPGTVTIPAGSPSADIGVHAIDDTLAEGTETVILSIVPSPCPECYVPGTHSTATAYILDDEHTNSPPTVSIHRPENGATFTAPTNILLIALAQDREDGENVAAVEFFDGANKIGDAMFVPSLCPSADCPSWYFEWQNVPPGNHTLTAKATDRGGLMTVSAPVHISVIGTNPPPERTIVRVVATDSQAREPGVLTVVEHGQFAIRRSGNLQSSIPVSFVLRGSAENGVDYAFISNRVVIPAGATQALVNVVPLTDNVAEGTETVILALESPVCVAIYPPPPECYFVDSPREATVFIADRGPQTNQPPVVELNQPQEGGTFTAPATIHLRAYAQDPEDGYGYNAGSDTSQLTVEFFEGTNRIGAGVFAPTLCPAPYCPYFAFTWSNVPPGNYILTARATDTAGATTVSAPVHIAVTGPQTNLPVVTVTALASSTWEDEALRGAPLPPIGFRIARSGATSQPLTVHYRLSGTASNGVDYTELPGVVEIPAGASNTLVITHPIDDNLAEGTETVVLRLVPPVCAAVMPPPPGCYRVGALAQATVSILDNDGPAGPVSLVPTGSVWRYLDNGTDLGAAWRAPGFDDASWAAGPAQLGYGDNDEATVVSYGPDIQNKFITTYFRRSFIVSNAASVSNLTLRVLRDDGGVVYLNGVEVYRSNMPTGEVSYSTLALMAVGGPDETSNFHTAAIDAALLVNGVNVVGVEIHQVNPASSDLSFDLELTANGVPRPPGRTVVSVVATRPQTSEPDVATIISPGQFAIRRTGNLGVAVPVFFTLSGTAANGMDYNFVSNRVVIPAGSTQATVSIFPRMDNLVEGTETVVLTIDSPACVAVEPPPAQCYLVGTPSQATVLINDRSATSNQPPVVTIVTPADGQNFSAWANVLLGANAPDPDGNTMRVEFRANGVSLGNAVGELTTPAGAWLLTWSNVPPGEYNVTAIAVDTLGARGTSAPVHITVTNGPIIGGDTLISTGAVWKYHDLGIDLGTTWRLPGYDDTSWSAGPAQLGYGDGDEATVINSGSPDGSRSPTAYFRHSFFVDDGGGVRSLRLRLLYDDGAVVYLNGAEVFRVNLPSGPISYNTLAMLSPDNAIAEVNLPASGLVSGRNVIAVEVHQSSLLSSDLSFDLQLLGSTDVPPARPPTVTLAAPADGAVFQAPTNVTLAAEAFDPDGSHTLRLIEFFANGLRLGGRTNFPGADPIFPFTFAWMNVPTGTHTLTAVATDRDGAKGTSAPVHITVRGSEPPPGERELHVVGIYSGLYNGSSSPNHERGDAEVIVDRPGKSVTLFLSAYEPVLWHLTVNAGTTVERVFLAGYYQQDIVGLPPGTEITRTAEYIGHTLECASFYLRVPAIQRLTGLEISSFHGSYTPTQPFVINSVQNDPRLRSDFPQPVPAAEVPALSFRLAFAQRGNGEVLFQNYTLQGPASGTDVIPAMRVHGEPAGRYYFGAESHEVWRIDTHSGVANQMQLPPDLPEFSWAWSGAYDTQRNRFLVVSFGGEGHLYGYSPPTDQWRVVRSMDNLDLSALVYHGATDQLFGLSMMFSECDRPVLYRLSAEGEVIDNIRLPIVPFGRYGARAELVSVGEYLVLLFKANGSLSEPSDSRIYLIDPRTGEFWLTYRHVPNDDTDRDGVPNHLDRCPNTATGAVVDAHGCSNEQRDSDHDGVPDSQDSCPNTPSGVPVNQQGCPLTPLDSDGDGVPNSEDNCPNTPAGEVVNGNGCSIAQIAPCNGAWRNHVHYVSAVREAATHFLEAGLITKQERERIIDAASRSDCGHRTPVLRVPVQRAAEIRANGCRLVLEGDGPLTCVIECSDDLIQWTPISTNTLSGASIEIMDPGANGAARRFYRMRSAGPLSIRKSGGDGK